MSIAGVPLSDRPCTRQSRCGGNGIGRGTASVPASDLPGVHRLAFLDQTRTSHGTMVCRTAVQNTALSLYGGQTGKRQDRVGMDSRSPDARSGRCPEKFPEKHQGDLRRTRIPQSFVFRTVLPATAGMLAVRIQTKTRIDKCKTR